MDLEKKVSQLVKMADLMMDGTVNDMPKNIMNFKISLETVKIILEANEEIANATPSTSSIVDTIEDTDIVVEESGDAPKRKRRRTKAQMEQAKALEALDSVKDTVAEELAPLVTEDLKESIELVEESIQQVEEVPKAVVPELNEVKEAVVNEGDREDWEDDSMAVVEPAAAIEIEKVEEAVAEEKEVEAPFEVDEPVKTEQEIIIERLKNLDKEPEVDIIISEDTTEQQIASLVTKYPTPFNISTLDRSGKVSLVADLEQIKKLVGNNNTADIKEKLEKYTLEDAIMVRTYKFLTVLPMLQAELN